MIKDHNFGLFGCLDPSLMGEKHNEEEIRKIAGVDHKLCGEQVTTISHCYYWQPCCGGGNGRPNFYIGSCTNIRDSSKLKVMTMSQKENMDQRRLFLQWGNAGRTRELKYSHKNIIF